MRRLPAVLSAAILAATLFIAPATARQTSYPPFDPSDRVLACIRGPWAGKSMESGGHYDNGRNPTYKGAYQSNRAFEVAYAIKLIPAEHWWLWGSHTWDRADKWHPMIQDEMARNAARARGLAPWSARVKAMCPQEARTL